MNRAANSDFEGQAAASAAPRSRRDGRADWLKGCAIVAVVAIHAVGSGNEWFHPILTWPTRAAVPAFLTIWAMLYERSLESGRETRGELLRRLTHLMLLYLVWSTVYLLQKLVVGGAALPQAGRIVRWVVRHYGGGAWAGQYFFLILIQLTILLPVLRSLSAHATILLMALTGTVLVIHGYCHASLPELVRDLGPTPFLYHLPYVATGVALARNQLPVAPQWAWLGPALIVAEFGTLEALGRSHDAYITPGVTVGSVLLCWAVMTRPAEPVLAPVWVSLFARNTMGIFVLNPLILGFIGPLAAALDAAPPARLPLIAGTVGATLALCVAVSVVLRHVGLAKLVR